MCVTTFMEEGLPMATASQGEMKKTLSLTGLTINAMALIAPGAFLWTTYQLQAAQSSGARPRALTCSQGCSSS